MKALIDNLTKNPIYVAAKTFAYTYLGFTLYLSFTHQIALFAGLGSHTPWVGFVLTDSLMVFGKMLRSHKLAAGTRRVGLTLQLLGAALSLTANVLAGDNTGDRILGAMVIAFMLIVEFVADHTKPAEVDTTAIQQAKAAATVAKAKATRAANKAAAVKAAAEQAEKEAARRERAKLNRLAKAIEKNPTPPPAPISAIPATDAHDTFPAGAYV